MDNQELRHYGVLGMRWGIRRNRAAPATKGRSTSAKEELATNISKRIKRMQLEKEYKSLEPTYIRRKEVKSFVSGFLKETGEETLKNFGTQFDPDFNPKSRSAALDVFTQIKLEMERRKKEDG